MMCRRTPFGGDNESKVGPRKGRRARVVPNCGDILKRSIVMVLASLGGAGHDDEVSFVKLASANQLDRVLSEGV